MIPALTDALTERGYDTLTPVQEAVTAPDADGRDLLVSAQTGSGKTVGFGLAIAPTLLGEDQAFGPAGTPLALVVAPTRELAFQVMQELRWLYEKTGAMVNSCVGGMDVRQERRFLERGTHIVVGTPGRLCDHIRRGALDLSDVRAVVLDEADEMLDLGFREDLEFILQTAPAERRTLLFSATVSPVIGRSAEEFQKDAFRINTINKAKQHADIAYKALRVAQADSDHAIFNLLRFHDDESAIVFANTRAQVNHLTARLHNRGLSVVSLSGELSQQERTHALQAMRDGRARVCVATDVAARGIDLPNLSLVIHADLPTNTESLLHRSGRTGRAGKKGISALIVPPKSVGKAERLLKWAKITAEWTVPPSAEDISARDEEKLLNDPSWQMGVPEEQAEFAARLLEAHGPEAVAAALVRMHLARHSAPEDLQSPDTPARRDTKSFGPSRWFALSAGRNDRAEARWLLPLILRATDLEKDAIGAIRVQDTETFVEIAATRAAAFEGALGADGMLADNITARAVEGEPEFARRPSGPRRDDGFRKGPKPHRGRGDDRDDRGARPDRKPRPPREDRPERAERAERPAPAPAAKSAPVSEAAPRAEASAAPAADAPRPKKPAARPEGRSEGKPAGKFTQRTEVKGYGKPNRERSDRDGPKKPYKPRTTKDGDAAPAKPAYRSNASDPSQRMSRGPAKGPGKGPAKGPGKGSFKGTPKDGAKGPSKFKGKTGGKPRPGGTEPPRRKG